MKLKLVLAGALLTLGLAAPASASHPGWQPWDLLGTRVVNRHAERDVVPAYGHRHYRQIKICAYQRPIRFYDLDVSFRNGGHQDLAVRAVLNPGQCTRSIDLYGHRRDIRFVTMAYETLGWHRGSRAFVRVYAR
ncbi:MAG: hypothetical protein ACKVRO_03365 [Micropepsaceae bacterium]